MRPRCGGFADGGRKAPHAQMWPYMALGEQVVVRVRKPPHPQMAVFGRGLPGLAPAPAGRLPDLWAACWGPPRWSSGYDRGRPQGPGPVKRKSTTPRRVLWPVTPGPRTRKGEDIFSDYQMASVPSVYVWDTVDGTEVAPQPFGDV